MDVNVGKTSRGFGLIDFYDANGNECSLQQSSPIRGDNDSAYNNPGSSALWLGLDKDNARMHLTREHAKWLVETLGKWLDTGKLDGC